MPVSLREHPQHSENKQRAIISQKHAMRSGEGPWSPRSLQFHRLIHPLHACRETSNGGKRGDMYTSYQGMPEAKRTLLAQISSRLAQR